MTALVQLDHGHWLSIKNYNYCSYLLEIKELFTNMEVNIMGMRNTTKMLTISFSCNSVTNN